MKRLVICVLLLAAGGCASTADPDNNGSGGAPAEEPAPAQPAPPAPTPPITSTPGPPGCGLTAAAFCDTFDAISINRGRAGELDATRWSLSRGSPQLPTANGTVIPVGPATLPPCRTNLPQKVLPNDDSLICAPNNRIPSNHLLVAVGAQNYGQNSYRIRQPFDFAGRTGKIVFDAETAMNPLLGWFSVAVTEDPAPVPGYSLGGPGQNNDEGGSSPRNGFIVIFAACNNNFDQYGVRLIDVFDDYRDALHTPASMTCLPAREGSLSRIEIRVSQQRIEVYGTPFSADGTSFESATLIYGADVSLPFSRGYAQLTVHNHATLKYSTKDAWFTRFDNVAFDGPVMTRFREYEIADSLLSGNGAWSIGGPIMNVGYRVRDAADGPLQKLSFSNVSLNGVTSARLSLASWYLIIGEQDSRFPDYKLKYRFNGGAWRERVFTAGELALLRNTRQWGQLGQILDVPLGDLVDGQNTLEFVTQNVPQGYPPAVWSIDLILNTQ